MPNLTYVCGEFEEVFVEDEWTLEELASAAVSGLLKYKGIDKVIAKRIISYAKLKINKFSGFLTPAEYKAIEKLIVFEGIDTDLAHWLVIDGWDVELLSKAKADDLAKYSEVGTKEDAMKIILSAWKARFNPHPKTIPSTPKSHQEILDAPPASARIRRIRGY